MPKAKLFLAKDIHVGLSKHFKIDVRDQDILDFARLSGDYNPLHTNEAYALTTNFQGRVAHGAYQYGLASAMAGMHLPGQLSLLTTVESRFLAPLYFPAKVRVNGRIISWNMQNKTGKLRVEITNLKDDLRVSEFIIRFTLHDQETSSEEPSTLDVTKPKSIGNVSEQVVLVTGATGGVGKYLLKDLSGEYDLIATSRNMGSEAIDINPHALKEVSVDLEDNQWMDKVSDCLNGRPLYGIVHAAWPGMPRGGLLKSSDDIVDRHVNFGVRTTINLARFLVEHAPATGGRLILIGSSVGSHSPNPAVSAYSLGKAALENTMRLLAPELAVRKILANTIAPTMVPIGINKQISEQQRKLEEAKVPLGRLCMPDDLAGATRFLLSDQSSFLSGQVINLTGAKI